MIILWQTMLLAFVLVACFTSPFWLCRKEFSSKNWLVVVAFAFSASLLLSCASISSVWKADTLDFHEGEFDGYFPWSKLSYPLHLRVYHTPISIQTLEGNVSFSIFLTNAKVMEVNGTFYYPFVFGRIPLSYSLDFPLFNDLQRFFLFLLILFTLFNIMGALIGIVSAHTLVKRYKLSHAVNMVLNPMKT